MEKIGSQPPFPRRSLGLENTKYCRTFAITRWLGPLDYTVARETELRRANQSHVGGQDSERSATRAGLEVPNLREGYKAI